MRFDAAPEQHVFVVILSEVEEPLSHSDVRCREVVAGGSPLLGREDGFGDCGVATYILRSRRKMGKSFVCRRYALRD